MSPKRLVVIIGSFVVTAAGIGLGLAVATGDSSSSSTMMGSKSPDGSMSSYYQS
jgi:hypothetical protein